MDENARQEPIPSPAVAALKAEAAKESFPRLQMERTLSEDIREEREDLKEAAEHTLNVILDLNLDGIVRWVSPSWEEVIGTSTQSVIGKPIADIVIENKEAFTQAVETLHKDDSRSVIVRFSTHMGKASALSPRTSQPDPLNEEAEVEAQAHEDEVAKHTIELEAQGILVYDRSSGEVSHVSTPSTLQMTVLLTMFRQCG